MQPFGLKKKTCKTKQMTPKFFSVNIKLFYCKEEKLNELLYNLREAYLKHLNYKLYYQQLH